jgi:hypothetical protein
MIYLFSRSEQAISIINEKLLVIMDKFCINTTEINNFVSNPPLQLKSRKKLDLETIEYIFSDEPKYNTIFSINACGHLPSLSPPITCSIATSSNKEEEEVICE